jgi:hypothetical protein
VTAVPFSCRNLHKSPRLSCSLCRTWRKITRNTPSSRVVSESKAEIFVFVLHRWLPKRITKSHRSMRKEQHSVNIPKTHPPSSSTICDCGENRRSFASRSESLDRGLEYLIVMTNKLRIRLPVSAWTRPHCCFRVHEYVNDTD